MADERRSDLAQDILDSDKAFRETFNRSSAEFHGGDTTVVPLGGGRVPDSMAVRLARHQRRHRAECASRTHVRCGDSKTSLPLSVRTRPRTWRPRVLRSRA